MLGCSSHIILYTMFPVSISLFANDDPSYIFRSMYKLVVPNFATFFGQYFSINASTTHKQIFIVQPTIKFWLNIKPFYSSRKVLNHIAKVITILWLYQCHHQKLLWPSMEFSTFTIQYSINWLNKTSKLCYCF